MAALNCIVDDSALLAGLEDKAKDDLKQWVLDGSINLFVPLYTLEMLNSKRSNRPPENLNARKTLEWLDRVSDETGDKIAGRVQLQGPEDQYHTWREVEQYLLPDTPLSSGLDNLDGINERFTRRLNLKKGIHSGATTLRDASSSGHSLSPFSSPETVPASLSQSVESHTRNAIRVNGVTGTAAIPPSVRPLLNFVVWRTYNGDLGVAGSGKYILLTNDRNTQRLAQKFGVRAKLLSQLNVIISKEAASLKTNGHIAKATPAANATDSVTDDALEDDEEEEEILFKPGDRPASSRGKTQPSNMMDPEYFGRRTAAPPAPAPALALASVPVPIMPQTPPPVQAQLASKQSPRGGSSAPAGGRGNKGSLRGRGQTFPRGNRRGGPNMRGQNGNQHFVKPIDPDSYARPPPTTIRGGRGGGRRLFDPNT